MRNHSSLHSAQIKRSQLGFTLVELLLVILVLSSLALATTFLVDGLNEQTRFDDTKTRLQLIRQAIVGDTSRTLNGQPDMRGFVADMGRLPVSIEELVSGDGLEPWGLSSVQVGAISPVTVELYGGWRGPYLEAFPESDTGRRVFRDGWGNADVSGVEANFGWDFVAADLSGVAVSSYGADGISDISGGSTEVYAKDYPNPGLNLVEVGDYEANLNGGLTVRFNVPGPATVLPAGEAVYLKLYYLIAGVALDGPESIDFPALSGVQTVNVAFPSDDDTGKQGRYAAVVMCRVSDNIYAGDCDGPDNNIQPYYFTLIPRGQLPTIPWNIQ
jgi:prepilin-type N-terminal cleavage/methylation domain-containing protein